MSFWHGDAQMPVIGFVARATMAYLFLFSLIKFLGQRTMSNLQAQDFLFAVVIGDVLGEPLINGEMKLTGPFTVALTLAGIHYAVTWFSLKSAKFRRIVDEEPIVLVSKGKILRNMMRRSKVTLDMLLMAARLNNVSKVSDIEVAVLEPNGEISVLTKSRANPITPLDLNLETIPVSMPSVLIEDGNIVTENLEKRNLTIGWLKEQLERQGITDPQEVFLALLESGNKLYISKKNERYH